MVDRVKIGDFLRQLRIEKGLTQEELAEQFGVSSRSVSRWENGNTMPELGILVELAQYYDVDIKEIIDGGRKSEIMEKETNETLAMVADYAKAEKQMTIRKKCLLTFVCVVVVLAIAVGFVEFSKVPLFNVQSQGIIVHSTYRYETEEGYKYFVLYSAPNYNRKQLGFAADNNSTLEINLKKSLFAMQISENPVVTDVAIYECGWESNDDGGRDFPYFDKVTFAGKEIWNKTNNLNDQVPEYVMAYEEFNAGSANATGCNVEDEYIQIIYSDGTAIKWDFAGNRIN